MDMIPGVILVIVLCFITGVLSIFTLLEEYQRIQTLKQNDNRTRGAIIGDRIMLVGAGYVIVAPLLMSGFFLGYLLSYIYA